MIELIGALIGIAIGKAICDAMGGAGSSDPEADAADQPTFIPIEEIGTDDRNKEDHR